MIVDGILNLLYAILAPIVNALPQGTLPVSWSPAAATVKSWVQTVDSWIPIQGPLYFWTNVLVVTLPALLAYRVGLWLYNRVRG